MSYNRQLTRTLLDLIYKDLPSISNKKAKKLLKKTRREIRGKLKEIENDRQS